MKPGPEEDLAHVGVAKPSDQALVEERGLERRALPGNSRAIAAPENARQATPGPDPRSGGSLQAGAGAEVHKAEAAGVVVGDGRAGREVEHHMVVRLGAARGEVEIARRHGRAVLRDEEAARHAKMHDQGIARRQIGQEMLARRWSAVIVRPVRRAAKFFGNGKRKSGRRCSTETMRAPTIAAQAPAARFRLRAIQAVCSMRFGTGGARMASRDKIWFPADAFGMRRVRCFATMCREATLT